MDAIVLVGLGVTAALLALTLRSQRPEMAMLLSLAVGLMIFAMLSGKLSEIVEVMRALGDTAALPGGTILLLVRVVGVSYITEFAAQLCRDAGEGGIAAKVELGGRLLVLGMSIPILIALMQMMLELIP
ncbi:MAG: stage III sporulation protein AD [Oscillospiraceae bacterium]|jgi:stage III sporulation protein AD|nr:stage III sporulation protein AD [Oscillospiraceae bacterium]